jgi:hypothetical protein
MMKQDFEGAEKNMKKGLDLGMPMKEAEGASMLQMGMLSMQKNDLKQGESYIRQAPQRPPRQRKPGSRLPPNVQPYDEQKGIPCRKGFLPQSKSPKANHPTDHRPDQTDRKIH